MILETLRSASLKHEVALDLLKEWGADLEKHKNAYARGSEEHQSLEALERELIVRREASLRSQVRNLVRETLKADGNPDAVQLAARAVAVYDRRSELVHRGTLPREQLAEAERDAREIARLVLQAKLRSPASVVDESVGSDR